MHSHIPLCFMITSQFEIIISLKRSLTTRPITYNDGGVMHK